MYFLCSFPFEEVLLQYSLHEAENKQRGNLFSNGVTKVYAMQKSNIG